MRALVTGATGFIGSNLCRALLEGGFSVRAFHRPTSNLSVLKDLEVETVVGDIRDTSTLQKAMQGVQVVFHCAAQLGNTTKLAYMEDVTVGGTCNLLQAALDSSVQRIVHTSSVAALGVPPFIRSKTPFIMDETHTWNYLPELWMYGYTKYLAELEVQKAVAKGLDAVIVNPSVVLGAGDIHRVSGNIIVYLAQHSLPVAVEGGSNIVHIADVVEGHLAALKAGKTGERYILGGENITHFELLSRIAKIIRVSPPKWILPSRLIRGLAAVYAPLGKVIPLPISPSLLRFAGLHFYYHTQKARSELHLPPPLPIDDAIRQCYDWYLDQGVIP
ncbi:MAG: NAD-dependent epimerase/dehydratase family protein [Chloroflexota bacterium]